MICHKWDIFNPPTFHIQSCYDMCGSGINIDTRPLIDLVPWLSKRESVTIDQA